MLKKPILLILLLGFGTSGLVLAGGTGIERPLLGDEELQKIEECSNQIISEDSPLSNVLREISQEGVNKGSLKKVEDAVSKDPILKRVQNSTHWKRFMSFCNHNGVKTATEFILSIGLVIAMELAFPDTVVVGFALHLLGRLINKHMSPIPFLLRIGITSCAGYFLFKTISVALYSSIGFDPFIGTAAVLSGFLASENAIGATPITNRPVGWVKKKIKEGLQRGGWKFENKPEVNEFNMERHVEVLIERLDADEERIQELVKLVAAQRISAATSDAVQVVTEEVPATPESRQIGQSPIKSAEKQAADSSNCQSPRSVGSTQSIRSEAVLSEE